MDNIYLGTHEKFSIDLTAEGFSMDRDDFDITVASPRQSVNGNKTNTDTDGNLIIYRDPALDSSDDDDESDSSDESSHWFGIVDTSAFGQAGVTLRVIATAYIPDGNAKNGIRQEVTSVPLGKLIAP